MRAKILFIRLSDYQSSSEVPATLGEYELVERHVCNAIDEESLSSYQGAVIELDRVKRDYEPDKLRACSEIATQLPTVFIGPLDCEPLIGDLVLSGAATFLLAPCDTQVLTAYVRETIIARRALLRDRDAQTELPGEDESANKAA